MTVVVELGVAAVAVVEACDVVGGVVVGAVVEIVLVLDAF